MKPVEVLRQLLMHAGEVVTKEELLEAAWPGTLVVDGSLATAISKLRKALGADGDAIVTLPRVGYRLGVSVTAQNFEPPPASDLHFEAGAPVPRRPEWRLTRRLDPSASGEVWLAEHPKTRETRVFKFASDNVRLKGLKREVTLARLLRDSFPDRPEFVRVLEWNLETPPYFLESEFAGRDLAEWAEQQGGLPAIPLAVRLKILADVARAMAAVHEVGVLHKDLKPRNILISPGPDGVPHVRVADFGSAALMAPNRLEALGITRLGFTQTTTNASMSGTLMYIAPEIFAGQSPTESADVYPLGVMLYQLVAGDFRKPLSPGWENDIADPLLRRDIADAAAGDPSRRLARADDLANRLERLDERRAEARQLAEAKILEEGAAHRRAEARARLPWIGLAATAVIVAATMVYGLYKPAAPAHVKSVAVLPFQNAGTDQTLDFLQFAVPDEITTILSETRNLSVRSFSRTRRYAGASTDPQKAGEEMRVGHVVSGHYLRTASTWRITLEAMDVATGGIVWRETIDVPAESPTAMRTQLVAKTRGGLAPALGATADGSGALPRNDEAYLLFLKTADVPLDPEPNRGAITALERASSIDPAFGPTWVALSRRYYVAARYATAGSNTFRQAEEAAAHALALDPADIGGASTLIVGRLERGEAVEAHDLAADLVRRRPDSADAHFVLSYVLRFAGLLDDSASHCNTAFLIDPRTQTSGLRSCAVAFILKGDYARARDFIQLDFGTDWANALTIHALLRENRKGEALAIATPRIPQWNSYDMLLASLRNRPADEVAALASAVKPSDDPETNYFSATHLAYSGQATAALQMLRRAVEGHYCSFPVLDTDPLLASVRLSDEFRNIRGAAEKCQQDFLARRATR
jgi:serine/threonine protein kinase